jgi:hypothetical protein
MRKFFFILYYDQQIHNYFTIKTLLHVSTLSCHSQRACNVICSFQRLQYENLHETYAKHVNFKLYYQQLHLKYLCNLASCWLQAPWGWHDSVETCRSVIICEIILHLLAIVQNNKRCTVHVLKFKKKIKILLTGVRLAVATVASPPLPQEWPTCFTTVSSRLLLARKHKSIFRGVRKFSKSDY